VCAQQELLDAKKDVEQETHSICSNKDDNKIICSLADEGAQRSDNVDWSIRDRDEKGPEQAKLSVEK
jgi:hypothetical protein